MKQFFKDVLSILGLLFTGFVFYISMLAGQDTYKTKDNVEDEKPEEKDEK